MKKYIFISTGGNITNRMFEDLKKYKAEDYAYIEKPDVISNKFFKSVYEVFFKIKVKIPLPLEKLWTRYFVLSNYAFNEEDEYYIILGNGVFCYYSSEYLNKLSEKYNIKYIVYFVDPLSNLTAKFVLKNILNLKKKIIYSFDYEDAKKNGFQYTMNVFSKQQVDFLKKPSNQVFFIGRDKGRLALLHRIWDRLISESVACEFIIDKPEAPDRKKGIIYNKSIDYKEMLKEIANSECILEVLQEGQSGVSLRYYEAIAYNKRLITNNKNIVNLPFYNPKYMLVFEDAKDIDIGWINNKVVVEYNYNDEFSPVNFLGEIRTEVMKED